MRTNNRMQELLGPVDLATFSPEVHVELQGICDDGWMVGPGEAYLLRRFYPGRGWESNAAAHGPASVEYEVNDIRIWDRDLRDEPDAGEPGIYLPRMIRRGLSFVVACLRGAVRQGLSDSLVAVLNTGVDDDYLMHGTHARFFTRRGDYPRWFDGDLEGFKIEAMAVIEAAEVMAPP